MKPPDVQPKLYEWGQSYSMTQEHQGIFDSLVRQMPEFEDSQEGEITLRAYVKVGEVSSFGIKVMILFRQHSFSMCLGALYEEDGHHHHRTFESIPEPYRSTLETVREGLRLRLSQLIQRAMNYHPPEVERVHRMGRRFGYDIQPEHLKPGRYAALYKEPDGTYRPYYTETLDEQALFAQLTLNSTNGTPLVFLDGIDTTKDFEHFSPEVNMVTTQDRRLMNYVKLQEKHGILYDVPAGVQRYAIVVEGGEYGRRVITSDEMEYLVTSAKNNELDVQSAIVCLESNRQFGFEWKLEFKEQ